jgi:hypothetical protein
MLRAKRVRILTLAWVCVLTPLAPTTGGEAASGASTSQTAPSQPAPSAPPPAAVQSPVPATPAPPEEDFDVPIDIEAPVRPAPVRGEGGISSITSS